MPIQGRLPLLFTFLLGSLFSFSYAATTSDPLFINMTSDDMHRSEMAIGFGKNQLLKGHPLVVFINDKGVLVAAKKNNQHYAAQQKMIAEIIKAGGVVYACPSCMKFYKIDPADLVAGVRVSNPDLMESELFKANQKTLSW